MDYRVAAQLKKWSEKIIWARVSVWSSVQPGVYKSVISRCSERTEELIGVALQPRVAPYNGEPAVPRPLDIHAAPLPHSHRPVMNNKLSNPNNRTDQGPAGRSGHYWAPAQARRKIQGMACHVHRTEANTFFCQNYFQQSIKLDEISHWEKSDFTDKEILEFSNIWRY